MRPAAASRKANPSCTRLLWLALSCVAVGDCAAVSSGLSAIAIRCTASTPTVLPTWHETTSEINHSYIGSLFKNRLSSGALPVAGVCRRVICAPISLFGLVVHRSAVAHMFLWQRKACQLARESCFGRKCWDQPVAVAGVCTRVNLRMIFALGPRLALASAAVSSCSTRPTCKIQ